MGESKTLFELAKVLRSKNAGPFEVTFDIIFDDPEIFELVKNSGVITRELVAGLYRVAPCRISHLVFFDPALAIKITMARWIDSGSVGDTDVYGAQQHAPLMGMRLPVP